MNSFNTTYPTTSFNSRVNFIPIYISEQYVLSISALNLIGEIVL